jgi:DNA polymerase-1
VDAKLLRAHSKELGVRLEEIEKNAYELAGGKFNLASPKQIGEIFV